MTPFVSNSNGQHPSSEASSRRFAGAPLAAEGPASPLGRMEGHRNYILSTYPKHRSIQRAYSWVSSQHLPLAEYEAGGSGV